MRVIIKRILQEFWEKHSHAESGLLLWYQRISDAHLVTFNDVKRIFRSADCNHYIKLITIFPPRPITNEDELIV
jgi:mRNA interferase HigB